MAQLPSTNAFRCFPYFFPVHIDFAWHLAHLRLKVHLLWVIVSLSCNEKKNKKKNKRLDGSTTLHQCFPLFPYVFLVHTDFAWHLAPLKVHLLWVIVSLSCNSREKTEKKKQQSRWLNYPPPMRSLFPIFFPLFASISRDIWHIYHSKCIFCG